MLRSLVGSEMCIRDRYQRRVRDHSAAQVVRVTAGSMSKRGRTEDAEGPMEQALRVKDEKIASLQMEIVQLKDRPDDGGQLAELKRRERTLLMRLSAKETEIAELQTHVQELAGLLAPKTLQLNALLLDPAVNMEFERLREQVASKQKELEKAQDELQAREFSLNGERLMGKCQTLQEENADFAEQVSEGRVKKLELEIELKKSHIDALKKSMQESHGHISMLDEEMEKMQDTIYGLQQALRSSGGALADHR
eukprot:TRINITY_DN61505_c0_g1_i1.p2 TRINITY_DN61505_c0_g1~~TRINITY_DN61505_c0_g1_i1.p2  ORF type:complete len:252 (+),score=91.92 TRINITY_DN61505_c0_g1_i1:154-909(+)